MKNQSRLRLVLILIIILQVVFLTSFVVGKYVFHNTFRGTVTFRADLAEEFLLRERTAVRQEDGSYQLTEPCVPGNEYFLLPGLDVPKDPHVVITGKSSIPAYLFLEVVDETGNAAVTFDLASCWIETNLKDPKEQNGKVYAYSTDGKNPAPITTDETIYIIKDNMVYVSETLGNSTETNLITIYAYLEEVR